MGCGQQLAEEMRARGFRVTPQRAVILETVAHMQGHIAVQEAFQIAGERLPGLNIATVYRTLETMEEAGLVDKLSVGSGTDRYSLRDSTHPHGHLVCECCGAIVELGPEVLHTVAQTIEDATGHQIDHAHLTLPGKCQACAASQEAN
jgi:Fur family ferric uptake transcriptional regulator